MWDGIAQHIARARGTRFEIESYRSVGGGSINRAYYLDGKGQRYFLKLNQASKVGMFEAEAMGLNEMADVGAIAVPRAVCWGAEANDSYIVLDWFDLGRGQGNWQTMGQQLAELHRATSDQGFGWHQNNTIGDTPQHNNWCRDWTEFYVTYRLGYQFKLARRNGGKFTREAELLGAVPKLLSNHHPEPALVHGDLWSGNAAFKSSGEPFIFDPATYYGDREVDIAMSELFGGFPSEFYRGYQSVYPLAPGYEIRKTLYNLYHILNHFNLFGGGYFSQAERMIQTLLSAA